MSNQNRTVLAGLFALAATAASAAEPTPQPPAPQGWIITLGIGPNVFTSFPGARSVSIWPTGYLTFHRPGEPEPFVAPDDGFGIALYDISWLKAGPVARFIQQRSVDGPFGTIGSNPSFFGLHEIGFTAELGGFVELWPTDFFRARFEARQGVSGAQAFEANIEIDAIQRIGQFTISGGPRFQFGDTKFTNAYFSVTPAEALLNPLLYPYKANGGLVSVGGLGAIKYDFLPSWSATAFGGVNRYVCSSGNSPIPKQIGSVNNFTAGLIVAYSFNWNGF